MIDLTNPTNYGPPEQNDRPAFPHRLLKYTPRSMISLIVSNILHHSTSRHIFPIRPIVHRFTRKQKHKATVVAHSTLTAIVSKAAACKQSLSLPPSQPLLQKV